MVIFYVSTLLLILLVIWSKVQFFFNALLENLALEILKKKMQPM